MTTLSWDLVGGNPAPGDRAVYREVSKDLAATARSAESALRRLEHFSKSCDESVWQGEAADAFRAKIRELPPKLRKLDRSHDTASRAMAGYGAVLEDLQPRARNLLERAHEARREEIVQKANRDRARAEAPDSGPLSFLSTPATPFDNAVEAAQNRQRDINRQIDHLRDQRRGAEGKAVAGLERAHDQGIKNDSWMEKRLQGIDKWVDKHADHLKKISGALKIVSAVAGVLSFIPVLNFIAAPIALLAGGAAFAIDGTLVATGNGSWKAVAVDAALMALPGAGKLIKASIKAAAKRVPAARPSGNVVRRSPGRGGDAWKKGDYQDGAVTPTPDPSRQMVGAPPATGATKLAGARTADGFPSSWPPHISREFAKDRTVELPGEGWVILKGLNERGHAQGMVAEIGPKTRRGKRLTRDPVGFLRDPSGKSLRYEELGHLLGRQLGGPNDLRNTVSLFRPANAPTKGLIRLKERRDMAEFEGAVRKFAAKETVTYSATPVYKNIDDLMPDQVILEVKNASGKVLREKIIQNRY